MLATPEITTTNVEEAAVIHLTVPRSSHFGRMRSLNERVQMRTA
jgi:hypothetical protein